LSRNIRGLFPVLEALKDLPREPLVYEAGGVIFASALLGFAHTMRHLLRIIGRRGLWILPMAGALLVLVAVGLHGYAWYILMPTVAAGDVHRFTQKGLKRENLPPQKRPAISAFCS